MTEKDMIGIFVYEAQGELSTSDLYDLAVELFAVDEKYEDYKHHIRTMQQHLKNKGILVNTRYGYWALAS